MTSETGEIIDGTDESINGTDESVDGTDESVDGTDESVDGTDESTETDGESDTDSDNTVEESGCGGCDSSVSITALAIVSVIGSALVLKKKED